MNNICSTTPQGSVLFRCGYQKLLMLTRLPRPGVLTDEMLMHWHEIPQGFFVEFPPTSAYICQSIMDRMNGWMFKPYIFDPADFQPDYQPLAEGISPIRPFILEQTHLLIQAAGQDPRLFKWITQIAAFRTNGKVM